MQRAQKQDYYKVIVNASQFINDAYAGKDVTEHLQNGEDPYDRFLGYTPLHIALIRNHSATLKSLMEHEGYDHRRAFALQDANGCSPLGAAIDENIRELAEKKEPMSNLKHRLGAEFQALKALPSDIKTEAVNRDNIMGVFAMCDVKEGVDAVFSGLSVEQKKEVMHTIHMRGNSAALLGHTPLMIASEFKSNTVLKEFKGVYKEISERDGLDYDSKKDIGRSLLIASYNGLEDTTKELLDFFEAERGVESPLNESDIEGNNIFHAALADHRKGVNKTNGTRKRIVGMILDKVKDRDLIEAENNQGYAAADFARSLYLNDVADDIDAKSKQLKKAEQNRKKKGRRKARKELIDTEEAQAQNIEIENNESVIEELLYDKTPPANSNLDGNPSEESKQSNIEESQSESSDSKQPTQSQESEKITSIVPKEIVLCDKHELFKDFIDSVISGNNLNEISRKKDDVNSKLGKDREDFDAFISQPSTIGDKSIKDVLKEQINERDIFKNQEGKLSNKSKKIYYFVAPELKEVKNKEKLKTATTDESVVEVEKDDDAIQLKKPVPTDIINIEIGGDNGVSEVMSSVTHSSSVDFTFGVIGQENDKSDAIEKTDSNSIKSKPSKSVVAKSEGQELSSAQSQQDDIISEQQRSLYHQNNVIAFQQQTVGRLSQQVVGLSQENQTLAHQVQILSSQNQSMNAALVQRQEAPFQQRFERAGAFNPSNIVHVEQVKQQERDMAQEAINNGSEFTGTYYSVKDGMFISLEQVSKQRN